MCGIAGYLDVGPTPEPAGRALVEAMTARIAHRGPDATSVVAAGPLKLGFVHLRVVDPEVGTQPFRSADGRWLAAVNGTIYNHTSLRARLTGRHPFRTGSDCEVVPHLLAESGPASCLAELDGMFAAAVWDDRERALHLLRDRAGIKPLYTYTHGNRVYFASEIKAFLAIPDARLAFDWDAALVDPLVGGVRASVPLPATSLCQGVDVVEPGTVLRLSEKGGRIVRSVVTAPSLAVDLSLAQRRELLRDAVADSVRATLTVADQPHTNPSVLLSGGFDSAAIAAIGAGVAAPACYTIDHAATRTNGDRASAVALAAELGLPLHVVDATGAAARTPRAWRWLLSRAETPMCGIDTLLKSEAVRVAAAHGVRVLLSGTGADELAGGFSTVAAGGRLEESWASFARRGRMMPRLAASLQAPAGRSRWDAMLPEPVLRHEPAEAPGLDGWFGIVRSGRLRDLALFGLQIDDRIAAAVGMECRVPFLTNAVAEAFAGVPAADAEAVFWDKTLLREAVTGLLPRQWRLRPKTPFGYAAVSSKHMDLDAAALLAGEDYALVREAVENPAFRERFDHDAFWRCVPELADDPGIAQPLLRLVNMSLLDLDYRTSARHPREDRVPVVVGRQDLAATPTRLSETDAPVLGTDVLLLSDIRVPDVSPILVQAGGRTIAVLDPSVEDDRRRAELLSRMDGVTTLAELGAGCGGTAAEAAELLAELVDAGLVSAASEAAAMPVAEAA